MWLLAALFVAVAFAADAEGAAAAGATPDAATPAGGDAAASPPAEDASSGGPSEEQTELAANGYLESTSKFTKVNVDRILHEEKLTGVVDDVATLREDVNTISGDYLKDSDKVDLAGQVTAAKAESAEALAAEVKRIDAIEALNLEQMIKTLRADMDAKTKTLEDNHNSLQEKHNNLDNTVTTNTQSINTNAAAITAIQTAATALTTRVSDVETEYEDLVQCRITPPEYGQAGSCEPFMEPGSDCTPACNDGFSLQGVATCGPIPRVGVFTNAECVPNKCDSWPLPTGVVPRDGAKPCGKTVMLDTLNNECEIQCDSSKGYTRDGQGTESGKVTCNGGGPLVGTDFKCIKTIVTPAEQDNTGGDGDADAPAEGDGEEPAEAPAEVVDPTESSVSKTTSAKTSSVKKAASAKKSSGKKAKTATANDNWPEPSPEQWVAQPRVAASLSTDFNGWKFGFCLLAAFNLGMATMYCYGKQHQQSHVRTPLLP